MSRPSLYSPELATEICDRLAQGESLRSICRDERMPAARTVHRWVLDDTEGFCQQYARARELQAEHWADEILDIADDGSNDWVARARRDGTIEEAFDREHVQRSTLRVDARKWLLSRVLPKKYGNRVTTEHVGGDGPAIQHQLDLTKLSIEQLEQLKAIHAAAAPEPAGGGDRPGAGEARPEPVHPAGVAGN